MHYLSQWTLICRESHLTPLSLSYVTTRLCLWYECDITPLTWSHITTETPTSLVPESHLLESAHTVKITSRFNTEIDSQFNLISTLWGATHDANDQLLKKKTEQAESNLPTSDSAETQTDPSSGRRVVTSPSGSRPMWLHCVDITYVCIPLRPDKNTSFFTLFFGNTQLRLTSIRLCLQLMIKQTAVENHPWWNMLSSCSSVLRLFQLKTSPRES